jgi:hypothetical protein
MPNEPLLAWRCGPCGEWYNDPDEAEECWGTAVTEGWQCPICKAYHSDEDEAAECCPTADESSPPPMAAPLELELAGQQRLPI